MQIDQLKILNDKLQTTDKPNELNFKNFVISPLSRFEKLLIRTLSKKH
jgi:hypothetical protein